MQKQSSIFAYYDREFRIGESFDMIKKPLLIGGRQSTLYMVDGFVKDEVFEKIIEFLLGVKPEELNAAKTPEDFCESFVSYVETAVEKDRGKVISQVLAGTIALVIDKYSAAIMIDARTYPARSVEEPENDRVLRGSHDGFVETLVFNTALIRRRIRDTRLVMKLVSIGSVSKTDVVMAYMDGVADAALIKKIEGKLGALNVSSLSMGQESLCEALLKKGWYNPFPKVRYTERPDASAASICEGKIVILTDNSPSAIIVPASIFDFVQESNDFYFPPFVGTYLRVVRVVMFFLTLFLTPVWYLLVKNPASLPEWLRFIAISEPNAVPLIAQLLIFEVAIDALKLASLNTPASLSNSFSVLGALILGEFAVEARWFVSEVILYMGIVAIGNFTQPSFELGYAFKMMRIMLIVLIAIFDIWGLIAGLVIMLALIATTRTIAGTSYLYPLIPFNGAELAHLFVRRRMSGKNS